MTTTKSIIKYTSKALGATFESAADIKALSGPKLAQLYSELTGKVVKRFSDHGTAVKRTLEAFYDLNPEYKEKREKSGAPATPKTPKAKREPGAKRGRTLSLNYPVGSDLSPTIREPRAGSAREKARDVLARKDGATVAEVMKVTGWNLRQAIPGIRLLHHECGYGLRHEGDSIFLVTK